MLGHSSWRGLRWHGSERRLVGLAVRSVWRRAWESAPRRSEPSRLLLCPQPLRLLQAPHAHDRKRRLHARLQGWSLGHGHTLQSGRLARFPSTNHRSFHTKILKASALVIIVRPAGVRHVQPGGLRRDQPEQDRPQRKHACGVRCARAPRSSLCNRRRAQQHWRRLVLRCVGGVSA